MLTNIGLFLIKTIIDLYIFVVILRLLLQMIQADYRNPISQFTIKMTGPVLAPLQKIIPCYKDIDMAIVALLLILEIVKFLLLTSVQLHHFPNMSGILLLSIADILEKIASLYFYAILARVIMSFLVPMHHNPIFFIVNRLVEPLLRPIRRTVPLVGGFDLSPLIALILLQIFSIFVAPVMQAGVNML